MKTTLSLIKTLAIMFAISATLTGCAYDDGIHTRNQIFNMGVELDQDMVGTNYLGAVLEDEVPLEEYTRVSRYVAHGQDATPGKALNKYRIAIIRTIRPNSAIAHKFGKASWDTVAIIPDHIPKLHRFDVIEFRNIRTWRVMKDFLTTGDGNAVLNIVCKFGTPEYDKCVYSQPSISGTYGVGPTDTEYKPSLKDYNFTFTPRP